jgi:hypothetical protein
VLHVRQHDRGRLITYVVIFNSLQILNLLSILLNFGTQKMFAIIIYFVGNEISQLFDRLTARRAGKI